MSKRVTRPILQAALENFAAAANLPISENRATDAGLSLEHHFGGWWTVNYRASDGDPIGCHSFPFGENGQKAAELLRTLNFASRVLSFFKEQNPTPPSKTKFVLQTRQTGRYVAPDLQWLSHMSADSKEEIEHTAMAIAVAGLQGHGYEVRIAEFVHYEPTLRSTSTLA